MAKLSFSNGQEPTSLPDGAPIQEACEDVGVPFACTEGVCGTCIIEVEEGMENLSPFSPAEEDFLGCCDKERMACQCRIMQGTVRIKF